MDDAFILCPLVGYSFTSCFALRRSERGCQQSPALATGLSPFDGVLPHIGGLLYHRYFAFSLCGDPHAWERKRSGALRLLIQLPFQPSTLIGAKLAAVFFALLISIVPAISALMIWGLLGGHLYLLETINLLFGHVLYGLLVGAIALFAASISESAATAAIISLSFTIGSWVLDFALAGRPGLLNWLSRLSLTQTLRTFEQGLLSVGLALGMASAIVGFAALAAVWLPPGVSLRVKFFRSGVCFVLILAMLGIATQVRTSVDVAEDRRNSFPTADERALPNLKALLIISVRLASEDPRYVALRRNVLA